MKSVVECVPNFSTSNPRVVESILKEIGNSKVALLDYTYDDYYNRLVVSFVGDEDSVLTAALDSAAKAIELIDMAKHKGQHPRLGAVDVVPFVPIRNVTLEKCVEVAKEFGRTLGEKYDVPVYLYGNAATKPERKDLDWIRKGEYEALAEMIKKPERKPDFGPQKAHPTAGATITGARKIMVGYNVNLSTSDLKVAKKIARALHAKKGGFSTVKAMAVEIPSKKITQVGMSIADFEKTPLHRVFELIKHEAERHNVSVVGSEFCGLTPLKCLLDISSHYLKIDNLSQDRILEIAIRKIDEKGEQGE